MGRRKIEVVGLDGLEVLAKEKSKSKDEGAGVRSVRTSISHASASAGSA